MMSTEKNISARWLMWPDIEGKLAWDGARLNTSSM